jgi:hypothetical protein
MASAPENKIRRCLELVLFPSNLLQSKNLRAERKSSAAACPREQMRRRWRFAARACKIASGGPGVRRWGWARRLYDGKVSTVLHNFSKGGGARSPNCVSMLGRSEVGTMRESAARIGPSCGITKIIHWRCAPPISYNKILRGGGWASRRTWPHAAHL